MPAFSDFSLQNLKSCHLDLQIMGHEVIKYFDIRVLCGHRTEAEQTAELNADPPTTTLAWPNSKHNSYPSMAVDWVPYPVSWERSIMNYARFYHLAGLVRGLALKMDINIRWGGDWDSDFVFTDQRFHDLPHFELVGYDD